MANILEDYITRDELAAELRITARTLIRYENEPDGLPNMVLGGRKYYRRDAVRDWLRKREHQPNPRRVA